MCRLHYIFICNQRCVKFLKVVDTHMIHSVSIRGAVDRDKWSDTILFAKTFSPFNNPEPFSITSVSCNKIHSLIIFQSYSSFLSFIFNVFLPSIL